VLRLPNSAISKVFGNCVAKTFGSATLRPQIIGYLLLKLASAGNE